MQDLFCDSCCWSRRSYTTWQKLWQAGPVLRSRRPATGVSRALRARSVPESVPENGGCPRECPTGCLRGLRARCSGVSKRCPESVPGVSKRCPGHSKDTLGTPFGHSGAPGPKGPGDTLSDTPSDTPRFPDTLGDTPGPKGPRDPSSRPQGSQGQCSVIGATISCDALYNCDASSFAEPPICESSLVHKIREGLEGQT